MSMKHLGETIDIHSGGVDLVFPHHENERAQSMGATGKPFVKYWLHNGFLTIDRQKMSKSLGNFFTIDQVLERFEPGAVRFYLLSAHYRHPLDYSDSALDEAKSAVARIREAITTAEKLLGKRNHVVSGNCAESQRLLAAFDEAMDDDFNTQKAMGAVFEAVRIINEERQEFSRGGKESAKLGSLLGLSHDLLERLGLEKLIFAEAAAAPSQVDDLVNLLINARQMAKEQKQFKIADHIRDELARLGFRLQDHPTGTIWMRE